MTNGDKYREYAAECASMSSQVENPRHSRSAFTKAPSYVRVGKKQVGNCPHCRSCNQQAP
jgi:hypothetical protein